jgi:MFS transporter, ACS family, hexuronate transporter
MSKTSCTDDVSQKSPAGAQTPWQSWQENWRRMLLTRGVSAASSIEKETQSSGVTAATAVRWTIVALLFLATAVNYLDRAVLGVLKPVLDVDLGWNQIDYGWMVTAFQATYAVGYVLAGRWFDETGARFGLLIAVTAWSFAAGAHALAHTVIGFVIARSLLGLAEGGFFPAAVKTVGQWFPQPERAFATGLFNSGSNAGAIICPAIVPFLAAWWGWRGAFLFLGFIGFAWVGLWARLCPNTRVSVKRCSRAAISAPRDGVLWLDLVRHRQTWAYIVGTTASAPIWWFYIFWAPDFLSKRYGLNLTQSSMPLMCIFLVAGLGGIVGGWFSCFLLRRGWTLNAARKVTFLACGICAVPVFIAPLTPNYIVAVALVAIAAAAHCGYAANLFALATDTVPANAVASLVGIGGMAGAVAGMFFAQFISRILSLTHNNYMAPFAVAASGYLLGLACIHLLLPNLESMESGGTTDTVASERVNAGNTPCLR